MRERSIIMGAESVRAILAGTKTQTRRVVKPQPRWWLGYTLNERGDGAIQCGPDYPDAEEDHVRCPYGGPGDRLWIKEGFAVAYTDGNDRPLAEPPIIYRLGVPDPAPDGYTAWRSPLFMPRRYSRLTLEVVAVRVERLQDISADDCIAEGYPASPLPTLYSYQDAMGQRYEVYGRHTAFFAAWDALNAKRGYPWASNPWVWAITFRRVEEVDHASNRG